MQKITLNKVRMYAFHGCMEEEEKIGGEYFVNAELYADVSDSFETDDLSTAERYKEKNITWVSKNTHLQLPNSPNSIF